MPITLEEIMAKMPKKRQKKILARAEELKDVSCKNLDRSINQTYEYKISGFYFNNY